MWLDWHVCALLLKEALQNNPTHIWVNNEEAGLASWRSDIEGSTEDCSAELFKPLSLLLPRHLMVSALEDRQSASPLCDQHHQCSLCLGSSETGPGTMTMLENRKKTLTAPGAV